MVTSTIVLDRNDNSWRSVVNTGDFMVLAGHTGPFRLRFGISSTSEGMIVKKGESIKAEETVYIQPVNLNNAKSRYTTIYVHKG